MNIPGRRNGIDPRLAWIAVGVVVLVSCATSETTTTDELETADAALVSGSATYTVTDGDTLSGIAQRAGVSLAALVAANGWPDGTGHLILPGDVVVLPPGATTPTGASSAPAIATDTSNTESDTAAADSTPTDANGSLACDSPAIIAAIGDPGFVTFDEIGCENGWAGGGYLDSENFYTPVILRAEGQRWVLQDWSTVCDRYPDMAGQAKLYCPGG